MQDTTVELCYQYLARLSQVRDTEIESIDLLFGIKLGEGNLSIVDRFCEFKVYYPLGHLFARSQNKILEVLEVDWDG